MRRKKRTWWPDDPFVYALTFRVTLLRGRYGGGKTALAVWWVHRLIAEGQAEVAFSNIPLRIPGLRLVQEYERKPEEWPKNAAILYDESWLELGMGAQPKKVREFLAYLRKDNCYLLLPSVLPLSRLISGLTIRRYFNGYVYGLPLWYYTWDLPDGDNDTERGAMLWMHPKRVFGWYDTEYRPTERWWLYAKI